MIMPNNLDKFMEKVEIIPDGCWNWTGAKNSLGYGSMTYQQKRWSSYRWLYVLLFGPIPNGLELDHLCKNPSCVNPCHLEVITHKENILRGQSPQANNARKTHCPKGHIYDLIRLSTGARECKQCKKDKGIAWRAEHPEYLQEWRKKRKACQ